ncbi:hypothetical protein B0H15DRAFT_947301 [Mycena belliarum]|uniref:Uncharacterized protein n=1 Tax=Mycena belliarum TaxID=1033014 RepID=A0AAD6U8G0_9AGAR|nr:hypothetical protein B0H15DRAFT_947301 [Mycena belliae]
MGTHTAASSPPSSASTAVSLLPQYSKSVSFSASPPALLRAISPCLASGARTHELPSSAPDDPSAMAAHSHLHATTSRSSARGRDGARLRAQSSCALIQSRPARAESPPHAATLVGALLKTTLVLRTQRTTLTRACRRRLIYVSYLPTYTKHPPSSPPCADLARDSLAPFGVSPPASPAYLTMSCRQTVRPPRTPQTHPFTTRHKILRRRAHRLESLRYPTRSQRRRSEPVKPVASAPALAVAMRRRGRDAQVWRAEAPPPFLGAARSDPQCTLLPDPQPPSHSVPSSSRPPAERTTQRAGLPAPRAEDGNIEDALNRSVTVLFKHLEDMDALPTFYPARNSHLRRPSATQLGSPVKLGSRKSNALHPSVLDATSRSNSSLNAILTTPLIPSPTTTSDSSKPENSKSPVRALDYHIKHPPPPPDHKRANERDWKHRCFPAAAAFVGGGTVAIFAVGTFFISDRNTCDRRNSAGNPFWPLTCIERRGRTEKLRD